MDLQVATPQTDGRDMLDWSLVAHSVHVPSEPSLTAVVHLIFEGVAFGGSGRSEGNSALKRQE